MNRLVALGLVALLLPACDSGSDSTPGPAPTVTVTQTESAAPSVSDPPRDACAELVGADRLAFVFVTFPSVGAEVASGFEFAGCANAFEATYQWRLLDAFGTVLADGFGTATCGSGCVGTFQQSVPFTVSARQMGTLEVFTSSAEDGSTRDLNSIPLVLLP